MMESAPKIQWAARVNGDAAFAAALNASRARL
jgi:hypothetical protein